MYALIVLRESLGVIDESWLSNAALNSFENVCHRARIRCSEENNQIDRLMLHHANLSGSIPIEEVAGLASLSKFDLNSNDGVIGTIPTELGTMTRLETLLLHRTSIEGKIPSTLGRLEMLNQLLLDHTNLAGIVPKEVCALRTKQLKWFRTSCSGEPPLVQCDRLTCCTACSVPGVPSSESKMMKFQNCSCCLST